MKITLKTFEGDILLEAEILAFQLKEKAVFEALVPANDYPDAAHITVTDLLVVHVETTSLNYQGNGRLFDAYPGEAGAVLQIKFDTSEDIM